MREERYLSEDAYIEELAQIRAERGYNSLDEAAEFVLEWSEMFDPYFVDYCEGYLAGYAG